MFPTSIWVFTVTVTVTAFIYRSQDMYGATKRPQWLATVPEKGACGNPTEEMCYFLILDIMERKRMEGGETSVEYLVYVWWPSISIGGKGRQVHNLHSRHTPHP